MRKFILWNTASIVFHYQMQIGFAIFKNLVCSHHDAPIIRSKFDRIGEEVEEDVLDFCFIKIHDQGIYFGKEAQV